MKSWFCCKLGLGPFSKVMMAGDSEEQVRIRQGEDGGEHFIEMDPPGSRVPVPNTRALGSVGSGDAVFSLLCGKKSVRLGQEVSWAHIIKGHINPFFLPLFLRTTGRAGVCMVVRYCLG